MFSSYNGQFLTPGMGLETYSVEHDNSDLFYGQNPWVHIFYLSHAVISGAARDAGNTPDPAVLRPGLVMGQISASGKWKQFDSAAVDGSEVARGILLVLGLNTQSSGANADRFMAHIVVRGNLNPEAACLASSSAYGLARSGTGLTVRKHLMYSIHWSDDFINELTDPIATRPYG